MRGGDAVTMRLSSDRNSPYYNGALIPGTRVFVNGVELERGTCVEASEEDGWAEVLRFDGGVLVIEEGKFAADTLRGRVELRWSASEMMPRES